MIMMMMMMWMRMRMMMMVHEAVKCMVRLRSYRKWV